MSEEIAKQLGRYIAEEIMKRPDREIKIDEPLLSSGLVDSFSLVDLSLFIQDLFGVLIDDTELNVDSFDTLEQLTALIISRKS
ncbi:MAG: acyl carrier protein [Chloroflexi bacterium]|nr:acyl carrier protein [Chloroflexota bacterium]